MTFDATKVRGSSAILSACGRYRWRLERTLWRDAGPVVAVLGVNPSTADAAVDDPTIRKDVGFCLRWEARKLIKGNLFGYRATDIKALRQMSEAHATGPDNDEHLRQIMVDADVIVAAWGPTAKLPPHLRRRWYKVARIADEVGKPLWCLGVAQDGQPRHTLMLGYDTQMVPWVRPVS